MKRDATTGEIIRPGQKYRTFYAGTRIECYSIVDESDSPVSSERLTQAYLAAHPDESHRVPPIQVME